MTSPAGRAIASAPPAPLWDAAVAVLRLNDLGGWTKPAPTLYPHLWSWDSAAIAIGLAHIDPDRALRELETLFEAQWADGRVPHIVYNPSADPAGYFPGPDRWACQALAEAAPRHVQTSGIVQPPIHAIAAWRIVELLGPTSPEAQRLMPRFRDLYHRLLAWHHYLAERRDPEHTGLLTIYHPWESGTDNSPRWDEPLARVEVGDVPAYVRRDLQHVADASHRPTQAEYDRYLWLLECLKQVRYDDAEAHRAHPFLVKDVLMSAIFAGANRQLARLAAWLAPELEPSASGEELDRWAARFDVGVVGRMDQEAGLALDFDARAGRAIHVCTWAGLAPLLVEHGDGDLADRLQATAFGPRFAGATGARYPVIPSTSPGSAGYRPHTYWRGPVWPIANWLVWRGLLRHPRAGRAQAAADGLRAANLRLLAHTGARFAEYFDFHTGAPLGSLDQSWTAALALDWLAQPA